MPSAAPTIAYAIPLAAATLARPTPPFRLGSTACVQLKPEFVERNTPTPRIETSTDAGDAGSITTDSAGQGSLVKYGQASKVPAAYETHDSPPSGERHRPFWLKSPATHDASARFALEP